MAVIDPSALRCFAAACRVQAHPCPVEVIRDQLGLIVVVDARAVRKPEKIFKRLYGVIDLFAKCGIEAAVVPKSAMGRG